MVSFGTKRYTIKILRVPLELFSPIDLSYKKVISPSFKNPLKGYQRPPVLSDFLAARNSLSPAPDFGQSWTLTCRLDVVPTGRTVAHWTAGHAGNGAEALVALHVVTVHVVQRRGGGGGRGRGHASPVVLLVQGGQSLALRQLEDSAGGGGGGAVVAVSGRTAGWHLLGGQLLPLLLLGALHVVLVHHVGVDHLGEGLPGLLAVLLELPVAVVPVLVLEPHGRHAPVSSVEQALLQSVGVLPLAPLIVSTQIRSGGQHHRTQPHARLQLGQLDEALQRVVEVPLVI